MPKVYPFYSVNEAKKPPEHQVHHNNSVCGPGKEIPEHEKRQGDGGYRLCKDCAQLNRDGK